jgi:glycolate oxidase FAD binding subunit
VDLSALIADASRVAPVGARTQWEVGGPPPRDALEVRAPAGIVAYEPADMTVTVGAGTPYAELDALLADHGQECALDPRSHDATVGGLLACGLSGVRRLRCGPVRDHVLQVRVALADGRMVKGGGPTVKNVTGYDLPRLFVGSFGTLGVITEVTLRCRPRPACAQWYAFADGSSVYRPSARLWDGTHERVLLEGSRADVAAQGERGQALDDAPALPDGPHRGRISVPPARVVALTRELDPRVRWCAELGVGTIHVAGDDADALHGARAVAAAHGGWLLREQGGAHDDDGFGTRVPNAAIMQRIKRAFDPLDKCNPGRLPFVSDPAPV